MREHHVCPKCGNSGEIYIPNGLCKNTIITCPVCKEKEDISYLCNAKTHKTIEEIEREEYERLKKIYERC